MKITKLTVMCAFFGLITGALGAPMPEKSGATLDKTVWEQIGNDNGILVWRKEIANSDVVAFKGQAVIDAPIAKVANVLIDTSRKLEWVAKAAEAKDIRQISDFERVEYNRTLSGFFLVRDRDFVFKAKADLDKANKTMHISFKSVEDPKMPETNYVRGEILDGDYLLRSVEDGKKTFLTVEIAADPKGSIPKWLVNLFQKSWPNNTIEGIRKQCAKKDVKEHARLAAFFK